MNEERAYILRQLARMETCLQQYETGEMDLEVLYGNLEFLEWQCVPLEIETQCWSLLDVIGELEVVSAIWNEGLLDQSTFLVERDKAVQAVRVRLKEKLRHYKSVAEA